MKMLETASAPVVNGEPLAVVGSDLDVSLVAKLTGGDKVMLEVNGTRIPSSQECPLVGETWEVLSNNPPRVNKKPTCENVLIISHPAFSTPISFHYAHMLNVAKGQPAVFEERDVTLSHDGNGSPLPVYATLQMVSHFIPYDAVDMVFTPVDNLLELIDDSRLKRVVLESWCSTMKSLKAASWRHKGVFRFAIHAQVQPRVIYAFQAGDWNVLNSLTDSELVGIHRTFHYLPMFLEQSKMFLPEETIEPRSDRFN